MVSLDFDFFYNQLEAGVCINETCFYFSDDETEEEHYLGFLPQYEKPYWVGYCDIPDGAEFHTAYELVNAPIFNNRSLINRWGSVRIISIEGLCLDDWMEHCQHV